MPKKKEEKKKNRFKLPFVKPLIFLGIIALIILIFTSKPTIFWRPIVNFLNAGVELNSNTTLSQDEAKNRVEEEINSGDERIEINEEIITVLARENFGNLRDLTIDIEENEMKLLFILNDEVEDLEIYGQMIATVNENNQLEINRVGTGRIGLPSSLNQFIFEGLFSRLTLGQEINNDKLVFQLLGVRESFNFENITLEKDNLVLENLEFNLFN